MGRSIDSGRYTKCYDKKLTKKFLEKEYPRVGAYTIANNLGLNVKTVYNYLDYYSIPKNRKENKKLKRGQKFGLLTLLNPSGKSENDGGTKWDCLCDCGKKINIPQSRIKSNRAKSCGCWRKRKKNHLWKGYCGVSGGRVSEIRLRAKKKHIDFNLTAEFLWNLYIKQNKKCAITGQDIDLDSDGSLDRIDSSKGYIENNVWWVTKNINKMKLDFDLEEFIELCQKVVTNKENIKYGREA